ncbi:hypothetical protein EYZ11_013112 [Aspergillus tanneri]|uniref:Uncharacterized protein n=1 Tax=Aspergillus tanneri TaxID=1220188 RepID=A0A4S3J3X3_9EURO|nr:hypothetical protein EYZ11_013112 [Aspergillus tanneri]
MHLMYVFVTHRRKEVPRFDLFLTWSGGYSIVTTGHKRNEYILLREL